MRHTNAEILDRLSDHARRLRVGQKLPADDPLPFDKIQQVRNDLLFLLETPGITLEQVSRAMGKGYSTVVLHAFKAATDRHALGDIDRVTRGVNQFLETLARRNEAKLPEGFVETEVARRMLTVIERTAQLGSIGLIYSDAGRGKSMTLEAASMIWPGSILVRVRHTTRTPSGLAKHLANLLRLPNIRTTQQAQDRLIDALSGTGRLMLIDEAHQLKHEALEFLRDLHDECGNLPIVLCGTIKSAEATADTDLFMGQFASRIALRYDLGEELRGGSGDGDPKPIHTVDEIRRLYESDKVRFTDEGRLLLTKIANLPGLGGLRLCAKIVQVAAAAAGGDPIDAELIRRVCRGLHGKAFAADMLERSVERSKVVLVA